MIDGASLGEDSCPLRSTPISMLTIQYGAGRDIP